MRLNKKEVKPMDSNSVGTPVRALSAHAQLARSVLANLLWEDEFYENGESNARRIANLIPKCDPAFVDGLSIQARSTWNLRHVPLFLQVEQLRNRRASAAAITEVIQRPDEMAEMVSIYWKAKKVPLANQLKKGLAAAFGKFNEYQLAKWDKNSAAISLRDVMFLCHPKPQDEKQTELFKRVADKALAVPDTWETELSAGADKKETFTRLMANNQLGALAFLRNLRGMLEAGVDEANIRAYAKLVKTDRVLPFRYIAAARHVPRLQDMLEDMMLRTLAGMPKLPGRTILVVDTSGSMGSPLGGKSEITRMQAAAALAIMARELCEDVVIYATAGNDATRKHATMVIPNRRGFALSDYICGNEVAEMIGGGGIFMKQCMSYIVSQEKVKADRVIVFTDEQDCSGERNTSNVKGIATNNYIANIASNKNGINSGHFLTITGFSEALLDFIRLNEQLD